MPRRLSLRRRFAARHAAALAVAVLPLGAPALVAQEPATTGARTEADRKILEEAQQIERDEAELRGLPFLRPVKKEVYTREQLGARLAEDLEDPEQQSDLADAEAILKAVGVVPDELDLAAFIGCMLTSQIAGFYDPEDQTLRCISSGLASMQRMTMVHEIYHALQDQHFPLEPYMEQAGERTDAARARQAVVEGDAQHFTESVFLRLHGQDFLAEGMSDDPKALAGFGIEQLLAQGNIPPYFMETLSWPYLAGATFIAAVYGEQGWEGVDALFTVAAPVSTEQILHPRKYLDAVDPPVHVTAALPAGFTAAGYRELLRDTAGEAEIAALIKAIGGDPVLAVRGSEGWGGDEQVVLQDAAGVRLLVWRSVWDSDRDAEQFVTAWRRVMSQQLGGIPDAGAATGPLFAERKPGAAQFAPFGRDAAALLPRLQAPIEGHEDVQLVYGERGSAPATLIVRRGRDVGIARGIQVAGADVARIVVLGQDLLRPAKRRI